MAVRRTSLRTSEKKQIAYQQRTMRTTWKAAVARQSGRITEDSSLFLASSFLMDGDVVQPCHLAATMAATR